MKTIARLFFVLLAIGFTQLFSCAGDEDEDFPLDGTNISMSELAGNWTAVFAVFSSAAEGAAVEYDVLEKGGSATLEIQSNGRYTLVITIFGEGQSVTTGQLGFDEDLLVVKDDDYPGEFDYYSIQLNNDDLSINGPAEFDFDNNGTDDEAFVSFSFARD